MTKEITKIVITGGPSGGKTTAMSWIQNEFSRQGYDVIFIPETATELITGGVAPWTSRTNLDYQKIQMRMQLEKEKIYGKAAETMKSDKVLIVCDRGAIDNKAYMTDEEFAEVLSSLSANETELREHYDAVFHLVTAAKGAEEFYTTANNSARTETPDEAVALDDKIINAWNGHPHLEIIDNSTDFEGKMKRLIAEIDQFLGEPEPLDMQRRYLIEYPDIAWLASLPNCRKVEIIQTYLNSAGNEEVSVRQRGSDGNFVYYQTAKRLENGVKKYETERRLTAEEYLKLLMDADTSRRQVRKTRYCLTYESKYFEIDVYPMWSDKAIVWLEMRENEKVIFPEQIRIIRDITDDEKYKNAAISKA